MPGKIWNGRLNRILASSQKQRSHGSGRASLPRFFADMRRDRVVSPMFIAPFTVCIRTPFKGSAKAKMMGWENSGNPKINEGKWPDTGERIRQKEYHMRKIKIARQEWEAGKGVQEFIGSEFGDNIRLKRIAGLLVLVEGDKAIISVDVQRFIQLAERLLFILGKEQREKP